LALAVKTAEVATPPALVIAVFNPPANVPLGPVCGGAVKVTVTPEIGLLFASVTVACSLDVNAALKTALCGVPPVAAIVAGGPGLFVSAKFAGVATPETDAATLYGPPAMLFAVNTADVATPLAFVVAVFAPPANVPLGPVCAGAANVTITPETGLVPASFTVTCSCDAKAALTVALCGVPPEAVMLAGAPAVFVSEKLAGAATPATVAETTYGPPAMLLAAKTAEFAIPLAFVVAVFKPPANVPLGPVCGGAVNVTVTPATALLPASLTVTCSGNPKATLIGALCGVPPETTMLAGGTLLFVSAKLATAPTPGADAVTL
jgi:hypothetical protein